MRVHPPKAYERAIALHHLESIARSNVANLYSDDLKRPDQAEAEYCEAIRLDPKDASPYFWLGTFLEDAGQLENALVAFRQYMALDPKSDSGQRGLAWVALMARGDVAEARTAAAEALAVEAWAGDWQAASVQFAKWVREFSVSGEYLVWISRNRLSALLRKAREAGALASLAEPIIAAAGRACWQPWAEALKAILAGRDAAGLSAKAAELHARIS